MPLNKRTPCVGICSTTYGDLVCRGCKRFAHEIVQWNSYDGDQQEQIWQRLRKLRDEVVIQRVMVTAPERFADVRSRREFADLDGGELLYAITRHLSAADAALAEAGLASIDDEVQDTRHETPTNEAVDGTTVYMQGGATLGGDEFVQFELATPDTVVVELDISEIEGPGAPFNVAHREDFPKELLVSKTYDRFFDGIDFDTYDPAAVEARLPDVLEGQTRVSEGTLVSTPMMMPPPPEGDGNGDGA